MEVIIWDSDFPYLHPNSSSNTSLLACLLQAYTVLITPCKGKVGIGVQLLPKALAVTKQHFLLSFQVKLRDSKTRDVLGSFPTPASLPASCQ